MSKILKRHRSVPMNTKLHRHVPLNRYDDLRPWLTFLWSVHFLSSILVMAWGGLHNNDTKYIPVDVGLLEEFDTKNLGNVFENCSKAFVNVFASSVEDPGALLCCPKANAKSQSALQHGLCNSPHWLFFASRRLTRFPEAWLLPLFPLFVRLVASIIQQQTEAKVSPTPALSAHRRFARRRFYLYVGLIQFRGWILYLLFDKLEEYLVASPPPNTACWYESLLRENYTSCQGHSTDFSDHVVLYFAQILPIAFMEVLHSFVDPFWRSGTTVKSTPQESSGEQTANFLQSITTIPTILTSGMMYLYIITFMGAYKTAAYFHTRSEIVIGFFISLLVQVPLCLMQCTSRLENAREYFLGLSP